MTFIKTNAALFVTVILTLITLLVKYVNDLALARRKDRLERVNLQLRNLYGPLYALDHATKIAWDTFDSRYRHDDRSSFDLNPLSAEENLAAVDRDAWRLWMSEVFMPFNLRMEKAIVENADLIIENEMPTSLLQLVAHIAAYKPVIKKWQAGDYSEHLSTSVFPLNVRPYVQSSYLNLKNEQAALIRKLKGKARRYPTNFNFFV